MISTPRRLISLAAAFCIAVVSGVIIAPAPAYAAANMYISGPSTAETDQSVTMDIVVNTGGDSANSFQATITYPSGILEGVYGTYSGTQCSLPIVVPDPSGGTAQFSCGKPGGFNGTGTVARVVFKAIASGTGVVGLSSCQVLKNDGQGTNITNGCTGKGIAISTAATPPPVATPTPSATPTPTAVVKTPTPTPSPTATKTPKPTKTPTPTPAPTPTPTPTPDNRPSVAEETPKDPTPTPDSTEPAVAELSEPTPIPTPEPTATPVVNQERRSVAQALQDILKSAGDVSIIGKNATGVVAILLTTIPFMALALAIVFLAYRLYIMERRRRHTLDRLFEMQLAEFAALEGKLDLLAEKGSKGREQYREEFKKAKEHILHELKPDYGKKADIRDIEGGDQPAPEKK